MATGLKTAPSEEKKPVSTIPDACPACGSTEPWGRASWCPNCGYYPTLMKNSEIIRKVGKAAAQPEVEKFNVKEALPAWAIVMGAGMAAVVILSFVANALLPETGPERAWWALGQCLLGFLTAGTGHFAAFLYAATKTDKFSPFDVFMKPVDIWKPSADMLPKAAWRFWVLAWGLTAILCGAFVVGGLRYQSLFEDWGVDKRADANLVQGIVAQARKEKKDGADNLEDAMNDFVGEKTEEERRQEELDKMPFVDCLIIGYVVDEHGELESILVAAAFTKDLEYVGQVSARDIPAESRETLVHRMRQHRRRAPFVKTSDQVADSDHQVFWLEPKLMCQVAYGEKDSSRKLVKTRFKRMLADVDKNSGS